MLIRKMLSEWPATLAFGLVLSLACQPAEERAAPVAKSTEAGWKGTATDDRAAITVTEATRQAVLAEMRTMLNAVQGIVCGTARWDTAAIRVSATSGGVAAASETEPDVEAQLGEDFVQLGMRTHLGFDSLAADVAQGKNREAVLQRLATVMGNCVGCHNQWRLVVQP